MRSVARDWPSALPHDRPIAEFSLWSADLLRLAEEMARIAPHADLLHVDVADGRFAPALLFFPDLLARVRTVFHAPIHVHLMVEDAVLEAQVDQFAAAGADLISIHAENAADADAALAAIAAGGCAAGVALRVETPVAAAAPFLDRIAFLTLLGTRIGVKGQALDPAAPARLAEAAAMIRASGRPIVLTADGGIRRETVPALRAAGASSVVLGSLGFGAEDLAARMDWLRRC